MSKKIEDNVRMQGAGVAYVKPKDIAKSKGFQEQLEASKKVKKDD
jgi:hypothetical protein